jgi:hypothetical protein
MKIIDYEDKEAKKKGIEIISKIIKTEMNNL